MSKRLIVGWAHAAGGLFFAAAVYATCAEQRWLLAVGGFAAGWCLAFAVVITHEERR